MSLATQVKVPAQVKGAVGGGGGTFTPGGTSDQFLDGTGAPKDLGATDIPTGVDAAKLADGSVSNTELQYINSLSSNAQTQITARLQLAGGTMTGDLICPAANFKPSGSGGSGHFLKQTSANGAISSAALAAGDIPATLNATTFAGLTTTAAQQFTGTQTTAGNSIANQFRDSSGNLVQNVASGALHRLTANGVPLVETSAGLIDFLAAITYAIFRTPLVIAGARNGALTTGQIHATGGSGSGNIILEAYSLGFASLCAGGIGTTLPEFCVFGLSSTNSPGAIESKAGSVTRASNGTWTDIYDLSKGAYHGDFYVVDSLGDGHARIPISSTTLGTVVDNASGVTYVDAGSVAAGNVGFRVNSGKLQINVGTSVTASTKFAIRFEGTVT